MTQYTTGIFRAWTRLGKSKTPKKRKCRMLGCEKNPLGTKKRMGYCSDECFRHHRALIRKGADKRVAKFLEKGNAK
jgi:hypothetical protein